MMDDDNNSSIPKKSITVVHCWSAPRSRSTALLYSFEARGSSSTPTRALDEPLYREWLIRRGNAVSRPYREELISATQDSWKRESATLRDRLLQASLTLPHRGGLIFCKHMAKHAFLYNFEREILGDDEDNEYPVNFQHKHLLLIRDPVAVLSSWGAAAANHGDVATPDEVGIVPLLTIYSTLQSRSDKKSTPVVVLDSDDLIRDPPRVLAGICADLGIEYSDTMLTWPAGPHQCDGPWAPWWYANVHQSSGWRVKDDQDYDSSGGGVSEARYPMLDPKLHGALQASFPAYEFLRQLTRGYQTRGPPAEQIYEDPRNEHLLVWIGAPGGRGRLYPRNFAAINPWDSAVQGGDATWEGLRIYRGKILSLDRHLKRLFQSAKALGFYNNNNNKNGAMVHTREEVVDAIFQTLAANGMRDGVHLRLTLTRGEKCTSSMNPQFNVYGTTLIILPEWKPLAGGVTTYDNEAGISLLSASQRRNSPQTLDSKIHHNNLINNILPKIQANWAKCADALMLDGEGYVCETNATNIFMVDYAWGDELDSSSHAPTAILITPLADHCLPGITRATVLMLAKELKIPTQVRRVSLAEFHSADEVFTTGTMGELTPVTNIDGRIIGSGTRGPITTKLQELYRTLPDRPGWSTEIPPFSGSFS